MDACILFSNITWETFCQHLASTIFLPPCFSLTHFQWKRERCYIVSLDRCIYPKYVGFHLPFKGYNLIKHCHAMKVCQWPPHLPSGCLLQYLFGFLTGICHFPIAGTVLLVSTVRSIRFTGTVDKAILHPMQQQGVYILYVRVSRVGTGMRGQWHGGGETDLVLEKASICSNIPLLLSNYVVSTVAQLTQHY